MSTATAKTPPIRYGAYPELTWQAIIVGYFLGAIITLSIGYAALILGFGIEGSELAAILGFGILRGILHRSSIVENNINQTLASAVNGATSGMMFSIPALFILHQTDFNPVLMVFGAIAGAVLGIAFIIPLRKQFIDYERLTYPGGVAVATILKSPGAGVKKATLLVSGAVLSAIVQLICITKGVENFHLGALIGMPEYMNGTWFLSLLTIGVAYIAGRGGFFFVIGGFVCYWFLAPILSMNGLIPTPETIQAAGTSLPSYLKNLLFRPLGIGMMIGGAITGVIFAIPLIVSAIKTMQRAAKFKMPLSKDEMPIKILYIAIVSAVILLCIIATLSASEVGLWRGIVMALMGTLWLWIAGIIIGECMGHTNWSPLSGMTLIAVTILIFISSGIGDTASIIASITVGVAICVSMNQAGDLLLDLKTGYLVGASPRKQQLAQFMSVWLGPILVMTLIYVLHQAYVIGSDKLPAPQGQALASMIQGIIGGDVPIQKYLAGLGLGALIGSAGIGGLAVQVGLGFYMPFNIILTYTIGILLRMFTDWKMGHHWSHEKGLPFAAGLIIGEALIGVGYAFYMIYNGM